MDTSTKVEYSNQELIEGYVNGDRLLLSMGVTSAHDAGAYGAISTRALQDACLTGAEMCIRDRNDGAGDVPGVDQRTQQGKRQQC